MKRNISGLSAKGRATLSRIINKLSPNTWGVNKTRYNDGITKQTYCITTVYLLYNYCITIYNKANLLYNYRITIV